MMKTSPESSRSSSRNSSVSPRERPSSALKKDHTSPPNQAKKQPKKTSKPLIPWSKRNLGPPKNCNGWSWVGEGFEQKVYLNVSQSFYQSIEALCYEFIVFLQNEEAPVSRICYASMKHVEGDVVSPRDCILLASGNRKKDLPFVAKVTALWESPDDGKGI